MKRALIAATIGSLVTAIALGATSADAWWIFGNKKPAVDRVISGYVGCERLVTMTGWDTVPQLLELRPSHGNTAVTLTYPTFQPPSGFPRWETSVGTYTMSVRIPEKVDAVRVEFNLTCAGGTGRLRSETKSFDIGRSGDRRNICNYGGIANPCDPKLQGQLGSCGFALATSGASAAFDVAWSGVDPPRDWLDWAQLTASKLGGGAAGIALACVRPGPAPNTISPVNREAPAASAPPVIATAPPVKITEVQTLPTVPTPAKPPATPPPAASSPANRPTTPTTVASGPGANSTVPPPSTAAPPATVPNSTPPSSAVPAPPNA